MNLAELSPQQFLNEYWQKKHRLIRQAFEQFESPLDPDELAGLACEEDVESRLVIQRPDESPEWTVRYGPFTAEDFAALPETHWTLLVQDVDKHVPECAELLDHFRFIPDWRVDDLMISYAAPGGSVGPHTDAYDVFLLQAMGERQWLLDPQPSSTATVPDVELKLLQDFSAKEDHLLAAGDMLYLPPAVAHYGIARTECMTFSVGFRAPSDSEMLADFAGWLINKADPDARYGDPDLTTDEAENGHIATSARARIRATLRRYLEVGDAEMDRWFGCFITEPKPWLVTAPADDPMTPDELRQALKTERTLVRSSYSRCHFMEVNHGAAILFCDGEAYDLAKPESRFAAVLSRQRRLTAADLDNALDSEPFMSLMAQLYNAGKFEFEHE